MKALGGFAVIGLVLSQCFIFSPKVYAAQGYANVDLYTSKPHVAVGDEFSVALYITGINNTSFGKASFSIESWLPNDPNPSFDTSDSDLPISLGSSVYSGANGYQCRTISQKAASDMTGKHLFGRFILRALTPGTYDFAPALPCSSEIWSLSGDPFVWNLYNAGEVTIDKPVLTSTQGDAASAMNNPTPSNTNTKSQVQSAETGRNNDNSPSSSLKPKAADENKSQAKSQLQSTQVEGLTSNSNVKKNLIVTWTSPSVFMAIILSLALWKRENLQNFIRKCLRMKIL